MKGFNLITHHINDYLAKHVFSCSKVFEGTKLNEVAENAHREGMTGSFPVIFDDRGSARYIGIDEDFPAIIYHRITAINFTPATSSYGDRAAQVTTASMRLVMYFDRRRINMSADEMVLFLHANFPRQLKIPKFGTVVVTIQNATPNNLQAFGNEYPGVTYFLKPEFSLINLNYTIESDVDPRCFKDCPE